MIDEKSFSSKPKGSEVSGISNRIINSPTDVSLKQLSEALKEGKTFVPAFFKKDKNGEIRRRKDFWYSQEVIALDFDEGMTLQEALKEFSREGAFIYTTFSHTEIKNKFRVVFKLSRVINNIEEYDYIMKLLLEKYPQADKHCKDCTRLFYGGQQIYELNYNNILEVDVLLDQHASNFGRTKENLVIYPAKKQETKKTTENIKSSNSLKANNLQLIIDKDIEKLRERLTITPIIFHSQYELYNFLKTRDLREYLGVNVKDNFLDIYHEETNPSASIYESHKNNGHQLYKCFSTSNNFCGSIFEVTQRLLGDSLLEVKKFLEKLYMVEVHESKQQLELKETIDMYKRLLQSEELEEMYPNFYKVFNRYRYINDLYILLDLVKEYLPSGEDPRLLFYHSIETLSKKFDRSRSVTHTRMNFFTFFKFISKLGEEETPEDILTVQKQRKKDKKHRYLNSTYELHTYSYDFFISLDKQCALWIDSGCTTKTMNYEGILRNFGVQEADRVFPQDKGRTIPELNEEVSNLIRITTLTLIEQQGWTTEQEVLGSVVLKFKGQKQFKLKQFKICIGEVMDDYGLERIRLNKTIKKEMEIETKGYGYIIRRIVDQDESYIGELDNIYNELNCMESLNIENAEVFD